MNEEKDPNLHTIYEVPKIKINIVNSRNEKEKEGTFRTAETSMTLRN